MRKNWVTILVGTMLMFGVGILAHQNFVGGFGWFNWDQFWHHESLAVLCFVSALSLLVGRYARK